MANFADFLKVIIFRILGVFGNGFLFFFFTEKNSTVVVG